MREVRLYKTSFLGSKKGFQRRRAGVVVVCYDKFGLLYIKPRVSSKKLTIMLNLTHRSAGERTLSLH
jgi:hypothetical protein